MGFNFKPQLLSIDWLNNHLYILGQMNFENTLKYQISRCDLNGKLMTVAIGGLSKKPRNIEVDPFNGYLFWVIEGTDSDGGLFRLDLGDISNGVKHENKPSHILQNLTLGAFTVDHMRYRILVADEKYHKVIAVSLDGKDQDDIRNEKNIVSSQFNYVKSLAYANGLFYWSNGYEVLTEDYHVKQKRYYHNAYPDLKNSTFVSVCVRLPSAQPVPIPVNPPSNIQALLSDRKSKVSWQIPHLLGIQGKGAWQEWSYELEVIDDNNKIQRVVDAIKTTTFTISNLKANTNYTFRAAAYTEFGKGPWSMEFRTKTLKTSHERSLIWSSNEGLVKTDVMGEHIETLVAKSELQNNIVTDIAWFEELLYIVCNSTLKIYNQKTRTLVSQSIGNTVGKIAIDWIGRRLYWSDQIHITRGDLKGNKPEPLAVYKYVRELKIDSLRGNMYYSTDHAVETCRLNGKKQKSYFEEKHYSGKQVMGLTLDYENQRVFWIIRTYDRSTLNVAPMAGEWDENATIDVIVFEQQPQYGPLTHFSDRLLWLQDENTAVIADERGTNHAHIRQSKLQQMKTVIVIDSSHRLPSHELLAINAIPEIIDNSSIIIQGSWKSFQISWDPVNTVTFGEITYEIRLQIKGKSDELFETEDTFIHYPHYMHPYTPIHATVRAFTSWGSSPRTEVHLHSPASASSAPINPRVFISHIYDPIHDFFNIQSTIRWNKPREPNGHILVYHVSARYIEDSVPNPIHDQFDVDGQFTELVLPNLIQNVTYEFEVKASTGVGSGDLSELVSIHTSIENPVPKVIFSHGNQINYYDMDLEEISKSISILSPVSHMVKIDRENILIWTNDNYELMMMSPNMQTKLLSLSAKVLSITVDWIERVIYWSQITKTGSRVLAFDLNKFESGFTASYEVFSSSAFVDSLQISPMHRKLFWIDRHKTLSEVKTYDFDLKTISQLFTSEISCSQQFPYQIGRHLVVDITFKNEVNLIWSSALSNKSEEENHLQLFSYNLNSKNCHAMNISEKSFHHLAKDSGHLYYTSYHSINFIDLNADPNDNRVKSIVWPKTPQMQITSLIAYPLQLYPQKECLYPIQDLKIPYQVTLRAKTDNSIILNLPKEEIHMGCAYTPKAIKYTILYKRFLREDDECSFSDCEVIETFDDTKIIDGLHPFTKYQFSVGVNNYYGEAMQLQTNFGPSVVLQTAPGGELFILILSTSIIN